VTACVAGAFALSACGISTDTTPRDILQPVRQEDTETSDGNVAAGTGEVYFVQVDSAGEPSRLVAVAREVEVGVNRDPTSVLDVLIDGPNSAERDEGITSLIPPDLQLRGWTARSGGVMAIDVSAELGTLSSRSLMFALAQIVHTVVATTEVNGVRITVEGRVESWPDANLQPQRDPLTVFDYPGLVRSSQPAFPAIPSGRPDAG
jgi:spore germination protein GerM